MAKLIFSITSPVRDAVVGRMVAVSGRVLVIRPDTPPRIVVHQILVAVNGGEPRAAQTGPSPRGWTCTVPAPPQASGGTRLRIVARAIGENIDEFGNPTGVSFEQEATVEVVLDAIAPDFVTIDPLPSPVTTAPGQPYVVDLSGAAGDAQSGIAAVQLKVVRGNGPDQPFVEVDEVVPDGPGRWRWTQKAVELAAGVHRITARALDDIDNRRDTTAEIVVREPIDAEARRPGPRADRVPARPARLRPPLRQGRRRQRDARPGHPRRPLPPAVRPADRAGALRAGDADGRRRPASPWKSSAGGSGHPPRMTLDQRFRSLAYQTFLRGLGTSARRSCGSPAPRTAVRGGARRALGHRAGTPTAPDRLDELTVAPDTITDDELEAADRIPVHRRRRPAATDGSRRQGAAVAAGCAARPVAAARTRPSATPPAGPRPLIDPDVIGEGQLRGRGPADPAYALWTGPPGVAHREAGRDPRRAAGPARRSGPLRRGVATFVGTLDLPALAAQDADGTDVRPDLPAGARPRRRSASWPAAGPCCRPGRAARPRIRRRRVDPAAGPEAPAVPAVADRRNGAPASSSSRPPSPSTPRTPAGRRRACARVAAAATEFATWRSTLAARTTAAAALETTYQRILDATEATVLPQLRDALVGELAQPRGDTGRGTAERLSRELLIDLQADASGQHHPGRPGAGDAAQRAVLHPQRAAGRPGRRSRLDDRPAAAGREPGRRRAAAHPRVRPRVGLDGQLRRLAVGGAGLRLPGEPAAAHPLRGRPGRHPSASAYLRFRRTVAGREPAHPGERTRDRQRLRSANCGPSTSCPTGLPRAHRPAHRRRDSSTCASSATQMHVPGHPAPGDLLAGADGHRGEAAGVRPVPGRAGLVPDRVRLPPAARGPADLPRPHRRGADELDLRPRARMAARRAQPACLRPRPAQLLHARRRSWRSPAASPPSPTTSSPGAAPTATPGRGCCTRPRSTCSTCPRLAPETGRRPVPAEPGVGVDARARQVRADEDPSRASTSPGWPSRAPDYEIRPAQPVPLRRARRAGQEPGRDRPAGRGRIPVGAGAARREGLRRAARPPRPRGGRRHRGHPRPPSSPRRSAVCGWPSCSASAPSCRRTTSPS